MAWEKILKISMKEANFYGRKYALEDYLADRRRYEQDAQDFNDMLMSADYLELNTLVEEIRNNLNNPEKLRELAKRIKLPHGNLSDSRIITLMEKASRYIMGIVYFKAMRRREQ